MMDPLTEALYRVGCLLAVTLSAPDETDNHALADAADELFEYWLPEEETELTEVPPMDSEQEEAFLADLRRRAAEDKAGRDREKMARAEAMSDEDSMTHEESEEELGVRPR